MTSEQEKQDILQDLHKELMCLEARYKELTDALYKWHKRFMAFWHESNNKLNGEQKGETK